MPYLIVSFDAANASDLAEELAQRLLVKQLAKTGFAVNSFEFHAVIDFGVVPKEGIDAIDADIADWIKFKHSTLKRRRGPGKRTKPSLAGPSEKVVEELVAIEVKR